MGYSWPGVLVDVRGASGRTGRFFHPAVVQRPHFIQFSLRPSVVYYVFLIWLVSFSRYVNKPERLPCSEPHPRFVCFLVGSTAI